MRPLLLFGVMYVFFVVIGHVGKGGKPGEANYGAQLLGSIVLFTFFAEATSGAVRSVVDRENLVRKIQFPRLVIPLAVVLLAFFNLMLNLLVVLIFALIAGIRPMLSWLELPLILAMLVVVSTGMAMLLSALFVRFRDIQPIWEVVQPDPVLRLTGDHSRGICLIDKHLTNLRCTSTRSTHWWRSSSNSATRWLTTPRSVPARRWAAGSLCSSRLPSWRRYSSWASGCSIARRPWSPRTSSSHLDEGRPAGSVVRGPRRRCRRLLGRAWQPGLCVGRAHEARALDQHAGGGDSQDALWSRHALVRSNEPPWLGGDHVHRHTTGDMVQPEQVCPSREAASAQGEAQPCQSGSHRPAPG